MRTRPSWALPTAVAAAALAAVAALPAHASTAPPAPAPQTAPAADWPTYIVAVRPGLDPAVVAQAYGLTPIHVYRSTLNGFAARLSPEQAEALRATALVESVEEDGSASSFGAAV
ncbi:protease inhibitor I9 family protein [Streptomyces sp. NPDC016562]|uniref:protease inhibitor I9 family protein n=1 Tax=Streptomyces sp. NPDC016562 TaxID=3364966 RepID=UPI003702397B